MKNEQKRDEQSQTDTAITDLPAEQATEEQADGVTGGAGKVSQQDFSFVMRNNSASPTLMG